MLELIPTNQWFVKVIDHKEGLKKKADECIWRPDFMRHRIHQWIDGLSWDWCISRQRYFGVPFPVWYVRKYASNDEWKIVTAKPNELPINPLSELPKGLKVKVSGLSFEGTNTTAVIASEEITDVNGNILFEANSDVVLEVMREADVMDTWATSSVSPQLSSKAINKEFAVDFERHQKLFPADLRPQAHEIIRTWAFYTIVKAYLHEDSIPWKNLMISGWCLAEDKSKMSKSKGNVVTPNEIIAENSADVVRYWASTSRLGADTAFSKDVLKIGRKLSTKLWNATKFAAIFLPLLEKEPVSAKDDIAKGIITEPLDKWAISRLAKTIEIATEEFKNYEYSSARMAIEDFFWNVFCDNYLEAVKGRYYDESPENKQKRFSAIHTIYHCLDGILRLLAPIMPHVTEELYQAIFDKKLETAKINSIHTKGFWPVASDYVVDEEAERAGEMLVLVLNEVRKVKADKNVSVKYPVDRIEINGADEKSIRSFERDLRNVTSAKDISYTAASDVAINVILAEKAEVA